jgi:hypothetical protein
MMHADDRLAGRRRMQMQSSRGEREARERLAAACGLPHVPAATLFSCVWKFMHLAFLATVPEHILSLRGIKFMYLVTFESCYYPMKFSCFMLRV